MVAQAMSIGKQQMTEYRITDPPVALRLLLRIARCEHRPVEMIWIDVEDAECAASVAVVGTGREWVRVRTETGCEKTLALWDVYDCVLLDSEAVA